ncbi:MAG: hypothetical protein IH881_15435 [Myxococcales bacterium]|nr:hypothetical protein [Myxococcales bacterium]
MISKVEVIAVAVVLSVVILFVSSSWWNEGEGNGDGVTPQEVSESKEAAGVDQTQRERRGDSQSELSSPESSETYQDGESRNDRRSRASEREVARSGSARRTDTWSDRQDSSRNRRAEDDWDREDSSEDERKDSRRGLLPTGSPPSDSDSDETVGDDPIDADLDEENPLKEDFDEDGEEEPSEKKLAERLRERAEGIPARHDSDDGEYPIERDAYYGKRNAKEEFDFIDKDKNGEMVVEEYSDFLITTEKAIVYLDDSGDGRIDFDESGLSQDDFSFFDRNSSDDLSPTEMQKPVIEGFFE